MVKNMVKNLIDLDFLVSQKDLDTILKWANYYLDNVSSGEEDVPLLERIRNFIAQTNPTSENLDWVKEIIESAE